MTPLTALLARLRDLFTRSRLEREMDDELRLHHELAAAELERSGLSPAEARRQATLRLGGLDQGKEHVRAARGFPTVEMLWRDVSHAARGLLKARAFALVSTVTLALGVAVSVAVFSIVDAVVLRPLPYPDPDRLLSIWEISRGALITVALAACLIAGRRAVSIDPTQALRYE